MLHLPYRIQFASGQECCLSSYVVHTAVTPPLPLKAVKRKRVEQFSGSDDTSVESPPSQRPEPTSFTAPTKRASETQRTVSKQRLTLPIHVVEFGEATGEVEVDSDATFAQLREMVPASSCLCLQSWALREFTACDYCASRSLYDVHCPRPNNSPCHEDNPHHAHHTTKIYRLSKSLMRTNSPLAWLTAALTFALSLTVAAGSAQNRRPAV